MSGSVEKKEKVGRRKEGRGGISVVEEGWGGQWRLHTTPLCLVRWGLDGWGYSRVRIGVVEWP